MFLNAIAEKLKRQSKDDFKGRHFEAWHIVQGVTWYLRYPLSYRDLGEMFQERGFEVDHSTINRGLAHHYRCVFLQLLNLWVSMIRRSWMAGLSIEATLELWASSLRDVKARIRPLFTQARVGSSAGLFLDGLLGDERRKTGWMRAEAAGDPGPWRNRRSWVADAGTPMICAMSCVTMRWKRWPMMTRCW